MSNGYRSTYYPYWGNNYNAGYTPAYPQNNNYPNSYNNGYNSAQTPNTQASQQPLQNAPQMPQISPYNNMPIKTNKLFVTGVEEAINRSTEFNSETIFFHQDLPVLYEVIVDGKGRKEVYTYDVKAQSNTQQSKEEDIKVSQQQQQQQQQQQSLDMSNYVTIKEFNALKENYNSLSEQFKKLLTKLQSNGKEKTAEIKTNNV